MISHNYTVADNCLLAPIFLMRHSILAMFFLPDTLLPSNNLSIISWLNLSGNTFTTWWIRAAGAGARI